MFHPRGNVLFGLAGGMLLIATGFVAGYYILGSKSEAQAATAVEPRSEPRSGRKQ